MRKNILFAFGACVLAVVLPLCADVDPFIVSGYPAANVSYPSVSAATALETGTLSTPAAAVPLEARYRTWDESDGIALRSDKFHMTMIIFR